MNPASTLVVVHCYGGEMDKLPWMIGGWLHHGLPVLFLSPEDSPAQIGTFECKFAGKAGWKGSHTWERQRLHWQLALDEGAEWYFLNDSDSFLLTPDFPTYLYEHPEAFFSNVICHEFEHKDTDHPNFQPPYFMHRSILQQMADEYDRMDIKKIAAKHDRDVKDRDPLLWSEGSMNGKRGVTSPKFKDEAAIDTLYTSIVKDRLGLPWYDYPDGTTNWPLLDAEVVLARIDAGARFLHPVKNPAVLRECTYRARRFWNTDEETIRVQL